MLLSEDRALNIAIILPAYNEADTIGLTLTAFSKQLPDAKFIVVDNNSTDDTAAVARTYFSKLNVDGIVLSEPRQGKGYAVRRAFHEVNADILVLTDADTTYPADAVRTLMEPVINGEADMVVGDRITAGDYSHVNTRLLHDFGNRLVRWWVNRLFHANLHDILSGYRVLNQCFVKHYPILVSGFELETDMTLHALDKRFRVLEIPIGYERRPPDSHSKLHTFRDGTKIIFLIAQLCRFYRPLLFFSILAAFFLLGGLLSAVPVLMDWFRFHYIYHVPLAILAAGLELLAAVLLGVGLILDSIAHQDRMRFERELLRSK